MKATLKGLTFGSIPQDSDDPRLFRRQQILRALEEQRQLAVDPTHSRRVVRSVQVDGGGRESVEQLKPIRPFWKDNPTGGLFLTVRYAGKPLEFDKGKAAILLADRSELVPALDSLIAATKAGELDELLAQQAKARQVNRTKRKAAA